MERKEDPKRTKARENRLKAQAWLEILRYGIGQAIEKGFGYGDEDVRPLLAFANDLLLKAVEDVEAAEKAYEPYLRRRYIHRRNPKRKT